MQGTVPSALAPSLPVTETVRSIVLLALREDVGRGDLTSEATVPATLMVRAEIRQKQAGVLCGLPVARLVFATYDGSVTLQATAAEGSWGDCRVVATLQGTARSILTAERTALNFLQRLSGVATASRHAVEITAGTSATVLDTRKTTPGHRVLEKYAVRVGGGRNHRAGLDDGVLIKENHIRAAGGITVAVQRALDAVPPMGAVEVEVTTLDELDEALAAGATAILVDNATPGMLRDAVERAAGRARIEASGGITFANLAEVARTGVDYISLGALTHSAPAIDFSLEIL